MSEILPTVSIVARLMGALAGPVARWSLSRRASNLRERLVELAEEESSIRKAKATSSWEIIERTLDIDAEQLASAYAALASPLAEPYIQMTIVDAIVNGPYDSESREVVRRGISTVLGLETKIRSTLREQIARVVEDDYHQSALRLFETLTMLDDGQMRVIQDAAIAARRQFQMRPATIAKQVGSMAKLEPVSAEDLKDACIAYCDTIMQNFRTLSVPTPTTEFKVELTDAFVDAGIYPHGAQEEDEDGVSVKTKSLLESLVDNRNVILFGDPGSGKSTNVRFAALELAKSVTEGSLEAIPFHVTLRNLTSQGDSNNLPSLIRFLMDHIASDFEGVLSENHVRFLLHSGRAVIFLDGLDEILDVGVRRTVTTKVAAMLDSFPSSAYVVTSRSSGYDEAPLSIEASRFSTAEFSRRQVADYADWFFINHGIGPYRQAQGVTGFMKQTEVVKDVRANPLMLGVLCGLYATGRSLPGNRTEVYRQCAEMLFEQWDQLKDTYTRVVDQEVAERSIRALAHQVLRSGKEEIALGDLHEFLRGTYEDALTCDPLVAAQKADETIKLWRGRRWILTFDGRRDGEEWYRFSHRTFLEYFAAEHVAYSVDNGKALFHDLRDWIITKTAFPFMQLSVQLTSMRRAADASLFLDSALQYIEDEGEPTENRLSCAVFVSELLAGLRVESGRVRIAAVARMIRCVSAWLPRVGFADALNVEDADGSLHFGRPLTKQHIQVCKNLAAVFLSLDSGRSPGDGSLDHVLEMAANEVLPKLSPMERSKLALFLVAVPDTLDSTDVGSPIWVTQMREVSRRIFDDHVSSDVRDYDEEWLVAQLAVMGRLDIADAVKHLPWWALLVGDYQYPVVRQIESGCPAYGAMDELLFGTSPRGVQSVARAVLNQLKEASTIESRAPSGGLADAEYLAVAGAEALFNPITRIRNRRASSKVQGDVALAVVALTRHLESTGDLRFVHFVEISLKKQPDAAQFVSSYLKFMADPESDSLRGDVETHASSVKVSKAALEKLVDGQFRYEKLRETAREVAGRHGYDVLDRD